MSDQNSIRNHTDSNTPQTSSSFQVTPLHVALGGIAILLGGAFVTGSAHYASTAKKLAEDGITPRARLKAMPVAIHALGASTVVCLGLGAVIAGAWHFSGGEYRSIANVSTISDAIAIAKQQRDLVRQELRSKIFSDEMHAEHDKK